MDNTVPLFIRLDGKHIQIRANLDWSVYQLKQHLYLHVEKSAENLKIIFAGCELGNHVILKNCQLSCGTIVHAIDVSSNDGKSTQKRFIPSTNVIAPALNGIRLTSQRRRARFYIYCKFQCEAVKPGKLRVRCESCRDEAFEINSGPNSWDDVLNPKRISGKCNTGNCVGNFAEFHFICNEHENTQLGNRQSVIPLPLFRTNLQDISCLGCTDVTECVMVFPCPESHVICVDCFSTYIRTKLDSRQFILKDDIGYTLPCPGMGRGCDTSFIEEVHHFMAIGKTQYERYKNFATEEFVLRNGGILCPAEGCGNGLIPEDDSRKVICRRSLEGCGFAFCRLCHLDYHDGECGQISGAEGVNSENLYEIDGRNAQMARWRDDACSKDTIEKTTKCCPGCKVPTEKSGGCNHMSCARCNFEWCWLCLLAWGRNCEADHWFRAS